MSAKFPLTTPSYNENLKTIGQTVVVEEVAHDEPPHQDANYLHIHYFCYGA